MSHAEGTRLWRVVRGAPQALASVPGHSDVAGIERVLLFDRTLLPGTIAHCAAHVVSERHAPSGAWEYTKPHCHECDEVNVLLSEGAGLRYRYEIDGVATEVESPCTVFLGAGTMHRMEAIAGSGIFICIHLGSGERP